MTMEYDSIGFWGNELQSRFLEQASDSFRYYMEGIDLARAEGIKVAAETGIAALQEDESLSVKDARSIWQYSQCLKKFRYGCTATQEELQEGWIERNKQCSAPRLPWWVARRMRELLKPLEEPFAESASRVDGRFGNGAVYEGYTAFARWNLTSTFPYDIRTPDCVRGMQYSSFTAARLCAVPKDMFKLRLITVEPAEATFLQQYNRRRLLEAVQWLPHSSGIPQQLYGHGPELQRHRCLEASLTGRLATLDFKDASDSISWYDVQAVFPVNIVAALERSRSEYVDVGLTRYRCHMFAGMGNATTFLVESAFFWALVTTLSERIRDFTPVSVFGDDIVCGTRAARHPLFQGWLAECGITLNLAKSGLSILPGFREACGLVALRGFELPLTRVKGYSTENPRELVSLCDLCNNAMVASDEQVHRLMRGLLSDVADGLSSRMKIPRVRRPLVRSGLWLLQGIMDEGVLQPQTRWDNQTQNRYVKVRVVEDRVKLIPFDDVTGGEALGILNGQLTTVFSKRSAGYKSSSTWFEFPLRGAKVTQRWVAET